MLDDILGDCLVSGGPNAEERRVWPSSTAVHLVCDFGNDTGGPSRALCDEALVVPSFNYGQVEDAHLIVGHVLAQYLHQRLASRSSQA